MSNYTVSFTNNALLEVVVYTVQDAKDEFEAIRRASRQYQDLRKYLNDIDITVKKIS
jgi:hypothetical protein